MSLRISEAAYARFVRRDREPKPKGPARSPVLERQIQRDILDYLRHWARATWAVRVNSAGIRLPGRKGKAGYYRSNDRRGCPDILACVKGRFVAIEVKRPGEVPTTDQLACHDDIERAGGVVIVATSRKDVQDWVESLE